MVKNKKLLIKLIIGSIFVITFIVIALFNGKTKLKFDIKKTEAKVELSEKEELINSINKLIEENKLDEAQKLLYTMERSDAKNMLYAKKHQKEGNNRGVIEYLGYISKLDAEGYDMLLKALYENNKGKISDKIIETAEMAAYEFPYNNLYLYFAGVGNYERKNYEEAEYFFRKFLETDPENPSINLYYAIVSYVLMNDEIAIEHIEKAEKYAESYSETDMSQYIDMKNLKESINKYKTIMKEGGPL